VRALFVSQNLIGDSLNIYPALATWYRTHRDWDIDLQTLPDTAGELYSGFGIPLRVLHAPDGPYDFEHRFDVGEAFRIGQQHKVHIAKAYVIALLQASGLDPATTVIHNEDWRLRYDPPIVELNAWEKGRVLLSPFSRSCASQQGGSPNKMLPWAAWRGLIRLLREVGPISVMGAVGNQAPDLDLAEDEYLIGKPLPVIAAIMRAARLVVTIDNGLSHLAASQRAPMVLFYPACLDTYWIVPIGNPNVIQVIQLDPASLDIAELLVVVKNKLRQAHMV
jgi:ADP-heptose:LPS heptosyltransferase